ncbi:unnamed protein product [Arabidopsis thaliana]|uniref:Uncharacterized protein n=1 Tax=Arabidopsis thaliana TaxID=3702 RepID=A0A5S9W2Y9_ARATH|nr:unnamed protein product [Arabidopsis thaliana]
MNTFINIHIRVLFPTPERQLITHACWSFFFQSNYQAEEDSYKPFSTKDEKWIREEFNKKEEDPKKLFELFKASEYLGFVHPSRLIRRMETKNSIFITFIYNPSLMTGSWTNYLRSPPMKGLCYFGSL